MKYAGYRPKVAFYRLAYTVVFSIILGKAVGHGKDIWNFDVQLIENIALARKMAWKKTTLHG